MSEMESHLQTVHIVQHTHTHRDTDYPPLSAVVSRRPGCDVKSSAFGLYVKQIRSGACEGLKLQETHTHTLFTHKPEGANSDNPVIIILS